MMAARRLRSIRPRLVQAPDRAILLGMEHVIASASECNHSVLCDERESLQGTGVWQAVRK